MTAGMELQAKLDEIVRHARARARQSVADAGPINERFLDEQRRLGNRLRSELLPAVLGSVDAAALDASPVRLFGARGQYIRIQLPDLLACAYELGAGLSALLGVPGEHAVETGRVSAVFNLSGALFDVIFDDYPRLFERVAQAFNEPALRALLSGDANAFAALEYGAAHAERVEVRLLLKCLKWSLSNVRARLNGAPDKGRTLANAMVAALHAELSSTTPGTETEMRTASRTKSILPFTVVRELVTATVTPPPDVLASLDQLIDAIASTFWLIDDMSDVASDFRRGALNSVLVRAGAPPTRTPDSKLADAVAERLSKSDIIDRIGDELHGHVTRAVTLLQSPAFPPDPAARMHQAFSSYIRSMLA